MKYRWIGREGGRMWIQIGLRNDGVVGGGKANAEKWKEEEK